MTFECGPFFFFHIINAYQKGPDILIIDVMAYKNSDVIKDLRFCQIEKTDHISSARAVRLILPLYPQYTGKVSGAFRYQHAFNGQIPFTGTTVNHCDKSRSISS